MVLPMHLLGRLVSSPSTRCPAASTRAAGKAQPVGAGRRRRCLRLLGVRADQESAPGDDEHGKQHRGLAEALAPMRRELFIELVLGVLHCGLNRRRCVHVVAPHS